MTRLTAKDRPGREVQVVISRVVAKNQGHLEQAQVMIAAVAAAGKLGGTQRCLLLKSPSTRPA